MADWPSESVSLFRPRQRRCLVVGLVAQDDAVQRSHQFLNVAPLPLKLLQPVSKGGSFLLQLVRYIHSGLRFHRSQGSRNTISGPVAFAA